MNWIKGDIAIYQPTKAELERVLQNKTLSFVEKAPYIVRGVLKCQCGVVLLDFGIRSLAKGDKVQCFCGLLHPNHSLFWASGAQFKRLSIEDYIKQQQIEKQFNNEDNSTKSGEF